MKDQQLFKFIERLEASSRKAKADFGSLNLEQLNWKPNPKSWSVGQCLEHLITTNNLYFPIINRHLKSTYEITFWERIPFLPSLWSKLLLQAVAPIPKKKTKTLPIFEPSQSNIPADIVAKFIENNNQLIPLYRQLDGKDIHNLMVTSPAAKFIAYTLGTTCQLLVDHEERHLYQANKVMESNGFPKS